MRIALVFLFIAALFGASQQFLEPCKEVCKRSCENSNQKKVCVSNCVAECRRTQKNMDIRINAHHSTVADKLEKEAELADRKKLERIQILEKIRLLKKTDPVAARRQLVEFKRQVAAEEAAAKQKAEADRKRTRELASKRRKELETREVQKHVQQIEINNKLLDLMNHVRAHNGHIVQHTYQFEVAFSNKLAEFLTRVQREHDFRLKACPHTAYCALHAGQDCSCPCTGSLAIDETTPGSGSVNGTYVNVNGTLVKAKSLRHPHTWKEADENDVYVLLTRGFTRSFLNACKAANKDCQTPEAYALNPFCKKFVKLCTPYGLYKRNF